MLTIAAAYLCAFPFTALFFSGIGVVDALVIAGIVGVAGADAQPGAIAALIVWRVFTMAGPVVLGLGALVQWRSSVGRGGTSRRAVE